MNRFLLGALAMGAVFVLTSFAVTSSAGAKAPEALVSPASLALAQDPTQPQVRLNVTISYVHDPQSGTNAAFVWEWHGQDIVAGTAYSWSREQVTKHRATVVAEKK